MARSSGLRSRQDDLVQAERFGEPLDQFAAARIALGRVLREGLLKDGSEIRIGDGEWAALPATWAQSTASSESRTNGASPVRHS